MIAKNNIFNIRAGQAQWLGMTGVRLDISEVREVMKKYDIRIVCN